MYTSLHIYIRLISYVHVHIICVCTYTSYIVCTRILVEISVYSTSTPSVVEPHQLLKVLSSHTHMSLFHTCLYHIYIYVYIVYTCIFLYISVYSTLTPSVVEPLQLLQVLSSYVHMYTRTQLYRFQM